MRAYSNAISRFGLLALLAVVPALVHAATAADYVNYGNQLLGQQKYDNAAQYFGAAVKMDAHSEPAYRGLGYASIGKKSYSAGISYLEYALKLNPADQGLRSYLGKLYQGYGNQYYSKGDKTNAFLWWDKAIKTDPSNTQLAAYVAANRPGGSAVAAAPAATPTTAAAPAAENESSPGVNPWVMGGIIVALGVVVIFLF